ncbi:unnamed protein product [Alopecurus aequalis]
MQVEDSVVRSVFWTDSIGKANYKQFGQFVSFDTTFSTNQYGLPFAPIVGVDNYEKTVLFGAALLKDETEDTFKWLFTEFISVMGNNHPETIITDQCVAMANAIKAVLPFTIHRYFNFHVGKKMKEKLVTFFAARVPLHELLRAVIRNSFTEDEFENGWCSLIKKHNAEGEAHLERIYEIREQWVPAYFMNNFFPFTSSTGRSESTNSLFKHYVKRKDSISGFFKQEAAKIYTDPIYAKFAEEMKKTTAYNVETIVPERNYIVKRLGNYWNAEFPRTEYMVDISTDGSVYSCSCSKMSRDGIQCCHVLRVALHNGLTDLPLSFINARWTTTAGIELANMTATAELTSGEKTHLAVRHAIDMSKVSHLLSTVCTDDRSYDLFAAGIVQLKKTIIDDRIQRLHEKETSHGKRRAVDDPVPKQEHVTEENGSSTRINEDINKEPPFEGIAAGQEHNEYTNETAYRDPPQSTSQGFNMGERPKNHYEQAALKKQKKIRRCGLCRLEGHIRPDCPDRDKVGKNKNQQSGRE